MSKKMQRILIVDDNPENIKVVASTLNSEDLELAFALNGKEALERVSKGMFDLILMDVMMPGIDGFATLQQIKENPAYHQVPIIFLTAMHDEQSIEKAFSVGGADYVNKPFRAKELVARVRYQLERKEFVERLEFLASRDMLTGIYNRRKFFELATILFDQSPGSLYGIIADIDHFKTINDTHGHQVGDRVIQGVATVLNEQLPQNAILGRIGGEEFAAVFTAESADAAKGLSETLRHAVSKRQCKLEDGTFLNCTISLGLAEKSQDTTMIDHLLRTADEALYDAKHAGRNRVNFRNSPQKRQS